MMMTCESIALVLDDYLDDALDPQGRRAVEAHLEACPICRRDADALRGVMTEARHLARRIEPDRDLWSGIEAQLRERPLRVRVARLMGGPGVLAAAAAALILATATITAVLVRQPDRPVIAEAGPAAAADPILLIEAEYVVAVGDLERALAGRRAQLRPTTVAVVERSLAVIDSAIAEARAALARDRANPALAALLWNSYRSKLDLLTRAAQL